RVGDRLGRRAIRALQRSHGTEADMQSSNKMELRDEAVKVTWCACESCRSVGPRAMTIVRHHQEYIVPLSSECCPWDLEEGLVSSETEYSHCRPPLRNQIAP